MGKRKLRILTVLGARPQFVKASAVSRIFAQEFEKEVEEILLHTGQHYDYILSQVFFEELGLAHPKYNLEVGSAIHGKQTAKMLDGIEQILLEEKPDLMIVYGDTNSTLAGALAASKLQIPVVHVEAGLRSFDSSMPEEVNRRLTDHLSSVLFAPTPASLENLEKEGISGKEAILPSPDNPVVLSSGDVMYDNCLYFTEGKQSNSILRDLNLNSGSFILATVHRPSNTDDPHRLKSVFEGINKTATEFGKLAVAPLHPRTQSMLLRLFPGNSFHGQFPAIKLLEPLSYFHMLALEKHSFMILTDSGGVQKEAYFFGKPCVILRNRTEWLEMVEAGTAITAGNDVSTILDSARELVKRMPLEFPQIFGDGNAAMYMCKSIIDLFYHR